MKAAGRSGPRRYETAVAGGTAIRSKSCRTTLLPYACGLIFWAWSQQPRGCGGPSIGRHLGMFDDKVKVDAVYGISEEPMSAEEWKKQYVKEG